MKLRDYLDQERGRLAALAKEINAYPSDLSRWADGKRPIPFHYGAPIELATGKAVTRQEMFPNDWQRHWPELASKSRSANKQKQETVS